jgi:hypothetical protein
MTVTATKVLKEYPLQVEAVALQRVLADVERQMGVYQNIVAGFEGQHGCSLEEFEVKIERGEVPEHPSWETSIEWGGATDEFQKLQVIQKGLQWILNFLS